MCSSGSTSTEYNEIKYGESMREAMEAQIDLGDDLFRAESSESTGQPAWQRLRQDMLADQVLGSNTASRYKSRHEDDTFGTTEILAGDSSRYTQFFNQNGDISFRRLGEDGMGIHGGAAKVEQDLLERAQTQQLQTALGLSKRYGEDLTDSIRSQGNVQGALDRSKKLTETSAVNDDFSLESTQLANSTSQAANMYAPSARYRNGVMVGVEENMIDAPDGVANVSVDKIESELNPAMANRYNVGARRLSLKRLGTCSTEMKCSHRLGKN